MMRGTATILAFVSTVLFPWPFTLVLTFCIALFEPLVPLAVGIFADTLFYAPHSGIPLFTVYGIVVMVCARLVRSRLKPGIIGE